MHTELSAPRETTFHPRNAKMISALLFVGLEPFSRVKHAVSHQSCDIGGLLCSGLVPEFCICDSRVRHCRGSRTKQDRVVGIIVDLRLDCWEAEIASKAKCADRN